VLIPFLRKDPIIQQRITSAGVAYINTIAIGELFLGARLSNQPQQGMTEVRELAKLLKVITADIKTAEEYPLPTLQPVVYRAVRASRCLM
jgi:predicted nucleic acid-binding protein